MTDKELHKLNRREILQIMLTQGKEAEEWKQQLEERDEELRVMTENYERLRKRLDQKDEQIHELKLTLEREREDRRIELEEAGSIAEAALRLNGIFDAAQKAAEQYLYNIKLLHNKQPAGGAPGKEEPTRTEEAARKPENNDKRSAYEREDNEGSHPRTDRSGTAEGESQA